MPSDLEEPRNPEEVVSPGDLVMGCVSRYSRWHVLPYSLPITQCTPLHVTPGDSGAGTVLSRQATAATDRFAWCNKRGMAEENPLRQPAACPLFFSDCILT